MRKIFLVFCFFSVIVMAVDEKKDNKATESYFTKKQKETELNVINLSELEKMIDKFLEKEQIFNINSRLYNVGTEGQPAPADPNLSFFHSHKNMFCSPLSGYESKIFKGCKINNPLKLQHADLRPYFVDNKFNSNQISFTRNWIDNFLTPLVNPGLPSYIENPELLSDVKFREKYIRRLRSQLPMAVVANSLNTMLSERIQADPKDPNSQSILSTLDEEISGRYTDNSWQQAIGSTTDPLELQREQVRILALISKQLQRLDQRIERLELLNAAQVTNSTNQQDLLIESLGSNTQN